MNQDTLDKIVNEESEDEVIVARKNRNHTNPEDKRGRFFVIRQILNLLFMVIAVVGVIIYLTRDEMQGCIVVVIAMAFKMAECVFRYVK